MTFTNSVMIPKKDITAKNQEDSTQSKSKPKINLMLKLILELLAYENDKQKSSLEDFKHTEMGELLSMSFP